MILGLWLSDSCPRFVLNVFFNKFMAICRASGLLWATVEYFMIQYHKPSGRQHVLSVKSGGPKAGEESLWQRGQSEWGKNKKKKNQKTTTTHSALLHRQSAIEQNSLHLVSAFSSASADTHPRPACIYYIKPACEGLFCMSGSWKNVLLQWRQQLCILGFFS